MESRWGDTLHRDTELLLVESENAMSGFIPVLRVTKEMVILSKPIGSTRNKCSVSLGKWILKLVNWKRKVFLFPEICAAKASIRFKGSISCEIECMMVGPRKFCNTAEYGRHSAIGLCGHIVGLRICSMRYG